MSKTQDRGNFRDYDPILFAVIYPSGKRLVLVFSGQDMLHSRNTLVAHFASIALEKPALPQSFLFGPFECKIKLPMWGAGQLTGLNIFGIFEPIQPAAKIHNQLGEIYTFS